MATRAAAGRRGAGRCARSSVAFGRSGPSRPPARRPCALRREPWAGRYDLTRRRVQAVPPLYRPELLRSGGRLTGHEPTVTGTRGGRTSTVGKRSAGARCTGRSRTRGGHHDRCRSRTQDDPRPGRGGGARRRGRGPADAGGSPAAAGAERAQPHGDEGACRADHVDQLRRTLRRRSGAGRDAGPAPGRPDARPARSCSRVPTRRPRSPAGSRPGSVVPSGAPPPAASARSAASSDHSRNAQQRRKGPIMGGLIEFQTGQIADIGSQTLNQKVAVGRDLGEHPGADQRHRIRGARRRDRQQPAGAQRRVPPQVGALQPERAAAGPGREPDRVHRVGDQRPDGQHHPRRRGLRRRR